MKLKIITSSGLFILIVLSFWIFSRFTVDDAFISWRYGKNYLDAGIWNYNPTSFDMTQAYTNPIYAAISLIPIYFNIDIVLFYKIISTLSLLFFFFWYFSKFKSNKLLVALFLILPATMIHAYSGMETFLYVALLTMLFIMLDEEKNAHVLLITIILFLTRPESWILLLLVPLNISLGNISGLGFLNSSKFKKLNWKKLCVSFLTLTIAISIYFIFHILHFGSALPNTFYIKTSSNVSITNLTNFIWLYIFCVLPASMLIPFEKIKSLIFLSCFFAPIIFLYSFSSFQMDYVQRFAYHIFAPLYLYLVYVISNQEPNRNIYFAFSDKFETYFALSLISTFKGLLIVYIAIFGLLSSQPSSLVDIANYYPRTLYSHAELGKTLRIISIDYDINSIAFGDAGMTAYHSGLIALDNIGLASRYVAQKGVTTELLDTYQPDVIIFHSRPNGIRLSSYYQAIIYDWAKGNEYIQVGEIYWLPTYTLRVYAAANIEEIDIIAKKSKIYNNIGNREFFLSNNFFIPPWCFWKE